MFLGFPLHAAGRPSDARGAHLFEIKVPMLFLQGTRDALAATELIEALVRRLGDRATLKLFQERIIILCARKERAVRRGSQIRNAG